MIVLRRSAYLMVLIFTLVVWVGCDSTKSYDDDAFGDVVVLSREDRHLDFRCRPGDLWIVGDSLIVMSNQGRKDSLYVVIRGDDWSVKSVFGTRGEEKDDFRNHRILKNQECVAIYDSERGVVARVDCECQFKNSDFRLPNGDSAYNIFYFDSSFIYENYSETGVGELVKITGGEREVIHNFADIVKVTHDQYGYRGAMGVNGVSGRIVYAYQYLRRFDIYEADGKIVSINLDRNAASPEIYKGQLDRLNSTIHYSAASVTDDRIYLYYIGKSPKGLAEFGNVTYVEEFDWDGNPIKRYELNAFYSFVAYQGGRFVCVSPNSIAQFATYEIE